MSGHRSTARWVAGLFTMTVALQRFNVPGMHDVSLVLPIVLGWCALGVMTGILTVDRRRLAAWLLASGTTGVVLQLQLQLLDQPLVSPASWALFMVTWSPFTLRIVHNDRRTYVLALDAVVRVCLVLAGLCIAMMASQFVGLGYRDWLAEIVPEQLLLPGYATTYPVEYGSTIMRANGWIGLEPSFASFQLGIGILAALLIGARRRVLLVLVVGLVCTVSGSGFAIALVGVVVMAFSPMRRMLLRYLAPVAALVVLAANTMIGRDIFTRVTEVSSDQSSTSRRGVLPYEYLWPQWIEHPLATLLGRGPGSSQYIVENSGVLGLVVPTPVKIFFDYGLAAGLVLAAFLLLCYAGGHSRSIALSLLVSMWLLQPGATQIILLSPVLLLVTLWSRRHEPVLESAPRGGQPRHRSSTTHPPSRKEALV